MARFVKYQANRPFLEPTKETLDGIEEAVRWAENEVPAQIRKNMNELVFYMALVNQGLARKMSFGPHDPQQAAPSLAWKLPVRRISENYYFGWKIKQVKPAVWQLYNDSREAYYIEFGINWLGGNRRVRRPIRKLSLRKTMEFMMTTQAYHRVWVDIYANPKTGRHRGRGFYQIVQSPGGHGLWANVSEHEARGVMRRVARAGQFQNYRNYVRLTHSGWQVRKRATGGGSYGGPSLGRRLP